MMTNEQPNFWALVQQVPWASVGHWAANVGAAALTGFLTTGTWQGAALGAAAVAVGLAQTPTLRLPGMAPLGPSK